jgi:hypothetical protein
MATVPSVLKLLKPALHQYPLTPLPILHPRTRALRRIDPRIAMQQRNLRRAIHRNSQIRQRRSHHSPPTSQPGDQNRQHKNEFATTHDFLPIPPKFENRRGDGSGMRAGAPLLAVFCEKWEPLLTPNKKPPAQASGHESTHMLLCRDSRPRLTCPERSRKVERSSIFSPQTKPHHCSCLTAIRTA